jgi:tetratricopeptide (TPR) repeat protein
MPGRTADAISEYQAALDLRPDYWEAHFNLGALLASLPGRAAEAVIHLEAALRLKPDLEPARALIAQMQMHR